MKSNFIANTNVFFVSSYELADRTGSSNLFFVRWHEEEKREEKGWRDTKKSERKRKRNVKTIKEKNKKWNREKMSETEKETKIERERNRI